MLFLSVFGCGTNESQLQEEYDKAAAILNQETKELTRLEDKKKEIESEYRVQLAANNRRRREYFDRVEESLSTDGKAPTTREQHEQLKAKFKELDDSLAERYAPKLIDVNSKIEVQRKRVERAASRKDEAEAAL